jgi:hypothetical protein
MLAGDASWAIRNFFIGWLLDTVAMTIQLPPHHLAWLFESLDTIGPIQRCTTIKKWYKVLGELHSMVFTIPDGTGLFSVLQNVLHQKSDHGTKVQLSTTVHEVLEDFRWMATDLAPSPYLKSFLVSCLTPWAPGTPPSLVWVVCTSSPFCTIEPTLWCTPFSLKAQAKVVLYANPSGTITNFDLELAVGISTHEFLAQYYDVREATIHNSSNMATLWWQRKGSA